MRHDPEKSAARYLSGDMSRRGRKVFEQHILVCEECWSEVEVGRRGRSLAEQSRELVPQPLRELVRTAVAAATPPPKRWRWNTLALAAVVGLVAIGSGVILQWGMQQQNQPEEIAVLVADFKDEASIGEPSPSQLPRRLGDLHLQESRVGRLGDMPVTVHAYRDPAGHEVVIYQAEETFPVADGAQHAPSGPTWTARVDGAVLFCADHPVPSLVVGDDQKEVALAADELGLR